MQTPNEQMDEIDRILERLVVDTAWATNADEPDEVLDEFQKQAHAAIKRLVLEGQQRTVDAVFDMSPKAKFIDWKPKDAFTFFERLKAYEAALIAELGELGK